MTIAYNELIMTNELSKPPIYECVAKRVRACDLIRMNRSLVGR